MTEETNMSSEQEEQKETSEQAPVEKPEEPTVPLHEHTALRTRAQEAEVRAANLEGQLSAVQNRTAVATKSPMEIEIERQTADGIAEEDMTITPALYRQQQVFDSQQAEQTATSAALATKQSSQLASTNLAKAAHTDWQQTVTAAFPHMTKGEVLDIETETKNFGERAYAKAQEVLKRVNPDPAPETELSKSEAEAKVKADAEVKAKADAEKVPSQDEVLKSANPRIGHVMSL